MSKALEGVRILDFCRWVTGSYGTQMLADMGADVVKVEMREGNPDRLGSDAAPDTPGWQWMSLNRNKRSLAVDLKQPEGREIVRKLAARSDVLIHNFRVGIMEKLGLGYPELNALNRRLVYVCLSGFGAQGPYVNRKGQDIAAQAMGGSVMLNSEAGEYQVVGVPIADVGISMLAAYAVAVALLARERTGKGQEVQLSLLDTILQFQGWELTHHLNTMELPRRPSGAGHWLIPPPYGVFQTADKPICIAGKAFGSWPGLCRVLGLERLEHDPRFETLEAAKANRAELNPLVQERLRAKTREEWLRLFEENGVVAAPVNDYDEIVSDPQVAENEMVMGFAHPSYGYIRTVGFPIKFLDTPAALRCAPPLAGEHTADILEELGFSPQTIRNLLDRGIVAENRP